jgi:SAM-dependent methyltransferase
MHPLVFREFDRVCRARGAGGDVLEIGAVAADDTLLCLPSLRDARSKVGVSLDGPFTHAGNDVLRVDANDMSCFADASFDTVLTNSVLEHDRRFWWTLAEIERVARPGALIVIGVPGFLKLAGERVASRASRLPVVGTLLRRLAPGVLASTVTLQVHEFPADYYRFSVQAARDVFLEDRDETEIRTLLVPPRILAVGVKRHPRAPATNDRARSR